jgi:biopolymer transport protein ExbB
MNGQFSLAAHADNPIVWAILGLALFCYILMLELLLARDDRDWQGRFANWRKVIPVLLSALPLLGLLGTIAGLLATFRTMSTGGGIDQPTVLSGGIAEALVTTQLGLVTLIPGLMLFAWLKRAYRYRLAKRQGHA